MTLQKAGVSSVGQRRSSAAFERRDFTAPVTPESAKCIASNLNSLDAAIRSGDRTLQLGAASILRANLFAAYYDALPLVDGQKNWPPIRKGDTWDLNGQPIPYPDDALTPDQPES